MTGAPLRVEIQLVSNPLQGLCSELVLATSDALTINNVEYICNFMEIADQGMSVIENNLGGGPLKWVVQDYRNYSHIASVTANAELSISIPSFFNSLRSLFMSFREKSAGAITYFPLASTHFDLDWAVKLRPLKHQIAYLIFFGN